MSPVAYIRMYVYTRSSLPKPQTSLERSFVNDAWYLPMQYHQLVLENSEFIASDIALKRIFLISLD